MKKGTVVRSLSGHDKGCFYCVIENEGKILILVDGKNKTLSKPKRKNIIHVEDMGEYVELSAYNPLYDAHIRKELKRLNKRGGCCLG